MKHAREMIRKLMDANAKHRIGYGINDQTDEHILVRAISEVRELLEAPDDAMEMGDIFGILLHYCERKGWSDEYIESLILQKLPERFSVDKS